MSKQARDNAELIADLVVAKLEPMLRRMRPGCEECGQEFDRRYPEPPPETDAEIESDRNIERRVAEFLEKVGTKRGR